MLWICFEYFWKNESYSQTSTAEFKPNVNFFSKFIATLSHLKASILNASIISTSKWYFTEITGKTATSVFQIGHRSFLKVLYIAQCFVQTDVVVEILVIKLHQKYEKWGPSWDASASIFLVLYLFAGDSAFLSWHTVVVDCNRTIPFQMGISKAPQNICIACTVLYVRHFIITLVVIIFQIAHRALQEVCRIVSYQNISVDKPSPQMRHIHMNDCFSSLHAGSSTMRNFPIKTNGRKGIPLTYYGKLSMQS